MNIHDREYLGVTDKGVALLRSRLRQGIRAVSQGKNLDVLQGSEDHPIPTFGGDTVLSLPKDSSDDAKFIESVIDDVLDIHLQACRFDDADRVNFIERGVVSKYPNSI